MFAIWLSNNFDIYY